MNQKGFSSIIIIIAVAMLAGAAGVFFFQQKEVPPIPVVTPTTTPIPVLSQLPEAPLATAKPAPLPTTTTKPKPTATPKPSTSNISAALGQQFTLRENQVATITGTGLEIIIANFINSPCPPNAECFWSGQGIELEYHFNGKTEKGLNLTHAFGYQITIVKSDYKTYATLVANK